MSHGSPSHITFGGRPLGNNVPPSESSTSDTQRQSGGQLILIGGSCRCRMAPDLPPLQGVISRPDSCSSFFAARSRGNTDSEAIIGPITDICCTAIHSAPPEAPLGLHSHTGVVATRH